MKREKISEAMGNISSRHIKEAAEFTMEEKPHKSKTSWVKWASVAACFCLIIVASIMVIPNILNDPTENADKITLQGVTVNSSIGQLTLTESNIENNQCTFTLIKENNKPIYICFRGFSILETYNDENGVEHKKVQQYHIVTPYDNYEKAAENHIVLDNKLNISVNGEKVDILPTAPGTYEITIDYSELYEFLDHVEPAVEAYSFGSFVISDDLIQQ